MSHRLFVALKPPEKLLSALTGCMGGVEGAYWQTEAQLHLTLCFLGHVEKPMANDVVDALDRLRHSPIDARVSTFGTFDTGRIARIGALWVAAEPASELTSLASKVRNLCRSVGAPIEARRFLPHITLARFPKHGVPAVNVQRFLSSTPAPVGAWRAEEVVLFESRLGSGGVHYEPVERFRFAGERLDGDFGDQRFRA